MNEEQQTPPIEQVSEIKGKWKHYFTTVTLLSKTLAMLLFVALPLFGFWLGVEYGKGGVVGSKTTHVQDQIQAGAGMEGKETVTVRQGKEVKKELIQSSDDGLVTIRAEKVGATTTVWMMGEDGKALPFSFPEQNELDDSGNYWRGLPPNVALHPSGDGFAYIDTEGIKYYQFDTNTTSVLRNHSILQETSSRMFGAYEPVWSKSGNYLLYSLAYYEGMGYGLLHRGSGEYVDQVIYGAAESAWIQHENKDYLAYAAEGDGYDTNPGLYALAVEDSLFELQPVFTELSASIEAQDQVSVTRFQFDETTGLFHFDYYIDDNWSQKYSGVVTLDGVLVSTLPIIE